MENSTPPPKTLGERLKQARVDAGFTQDTAAGRMGLKKQTFSSWENDRNIPDAVTLGKLARLYETTTDFLLFGAPTSPSAQSIADQFNAMSKPKRDVFVAMWDAFVKANRAPNAGYKLPDPTSTDVPPANEPATPVKSRRAAR